MNPLFEDSLLSSANAPFIEELYGAYLQNPGSVPPEWHEYFDKLQRSAAEQAADASRFRVVESFGRLGEELSPAREAMAPQRDRMNTA